MKLTDTQLEVLRFIPSSNTNAGATPLEMQKAGRILDGREWSQFPEVVNNA